MSDWQRAYALVRMTSRRPVAHDWLVSADGATLRTRCGVLRAEGRGYVWVLVVNLAAHIGWCRRCRPGGLTVQP